MQADLKSKLYFEPSTSGRTLRSVLEKHHENWPYCSMRLGLVDDYVNNILLEKHDLLVIVLESGVLVLFCLSKNQPLSILQTDCWASSVLLDGANVWSVGRERQILKQHALTGRVRLKLQENRDPQGYYESGIVIGRTHAKSYLLFNAGFYSLKLVNRVTNKVVRKLDLRRHLGEAGASTAIKEFYSGKKAPLFFFMTHTAAGSYDLHVFDYKSLTKQQEICVFPVVCPEQFKVDGYHLLVSSDETIIMIIFQIKHRASSRFSSHVTILTRSASSQEIRLRQTKPLDIATDLIICKRFIDEEIQVRGRLLFVLGTEGGLTETYALHRDSLLIEVVDLISKSRHMITQHMCVRNISICSSQSGEIIVMDITQLLETRFGVNFVPCPPSQFIQIPGRPQSGFRVDSLLPQ